MNKAEILKQISDQIDKMKPYGQMQIHVKRHADHGMSFSNADYVHIQPHKFTDSEPNVTATKAILSMIKGATISSAQLSTPTTLGFSISIDKHGKATDMSVQDFKKL